MNKRVSLKIKQWTFAGERMKQKIGFEQLYQIAIVKKIQPKVTFRAFLGILKTLKAHLIKYTVYTVFIEPHY